MIRVGLLGTGRIGSLHAENIASHRESTLTAVSDINNETANKLAAQYGAIVKSADEIISDTNIDAINNDARQHHDMPPKPRYAPDLRLSIA